MRDDFLDLCRIPCAGMVIIKALDGVVLDLLALPDLVGWLGWAAGRRRSCRLPLLLSITLTVRRGMLLLLLLQACYAVGQASTAVAPSMPRAASRRWVVLLPLLLMTMLALLHAVDSGSGGAVALSGIAHRQRSLPCCASGCAQSRPTLLLSASLEALCG